MPKLSLTKAAHLPRQYCELPQPNAIRFSILYRDGESYEDQTGMFKCRDFFNDCVAAKQGFLYWLYGWDNNIIKLNADGVYLLLSKLRLTSWDRNFALVSKEIEEQGFPNISVKKVDDGRLLFIPNEYWTNTYTISYLTALIRWCNNTSVHESFNDFVYNFDGAARDNPFGDYKAKVVEQGFKAPLDKWMWAGRNADQYTPENFKQTTGERTIHNCGARTWLFSIENGI